MKHVLLVKVGEIHLKGQNRPFFEQKLINNIYKALDGMKVRVKISQSRIYVYEITDEDLEDAICRLTKVFGIHALSPAREIQKDLAVIGNTAVDMMKEAGITTGTFKVHARRSDKRFPLESPEICVRLGGEILNTLPGMTVDVHNPQHIIEAEIREENAYVYVREIPAAGGMPVGTNGKAELLLSGGIDSPVAGYMIAKRGVVIEAVHFYSFPHTSERARQKAIDLAAIISAYCGPIKMHLVPFTEIQEALYQRCPDAFLTVLMRRYMMRIACRIAGQNDAAALITGESIGQVASQTMESLCATNAVCDRPVFRPLIGMDKSEITEIAVKIDTFKTSIQQFEDCCTVFTPRHPATHPNIEKLEEAEKAIEPEMIERALAAVETITVTAKDRS